MSDDDRSKTRSWLEIELADDMDEEIEQFVDDARFPPELRALLEGRQKNTLERHTYFTELLRLQGEHVKVQDWVRYQGLKVVVLFEGRDSATDADPNQDAAASPATTCAAWGRARSSK